MKTEEFYNQQWASAEKAAQARQILLMFDSAIKYSYELLGDLKGRKLLEIGCGMGDQLAYFASRGAEVVGIDVSQESLIFAQRMLQEQKLTGKVLEMSAEKLEFKDNSFDLIYINSALMHVDHQKVLQECRRVLKKGRALIILEPLKYNPLMMVYRLFSPYRKTKPQYMSVGEFRMLAEEFWEYVHREFYFFSLLSLPLFRKYPAKALLVSKQLERVDSALGKVLPWLKRLYWVSVVRYGK